MSIIANADREYFALPGIDHQTLASHRDGLRTLEVWYQTLEPASETPVHYHDCEEVVVVLAGSGRATVAGETGEFGPNSTLVIPAKAVHHLVNTGGERMVLLTSLSASPARVFAPDGTEIPIPWVSGAR